MEGLAKGPTQTPWQTSKAPTHLCMNGGLLKVPWSDTDKFFSWYVDTVRIRRLYLVEKITPRFKFFLDLDWVGEAPDLQRLRGELTEAIGSEPIFAVSPPKPKGDLTKYGVHAHWPDLVVTKKQALELRERLPEHIKQFADASVYNTGLRMLWSHKKDGSLPYAPIGSTNGPDVRDLRRFSIRVAGAAEPDQVEESSDAVEDFVRKYIKGHSQTSLKKKSPTKYESNSRYCERIGREHRSNHVYFEVSGNVIFQRCYDEECKGFTGKKYILKR
jgi:Herpesviridae UL52/UL70 DNA primase